MNLMLNIFVAIVIQRQCESCSTLPIAIGLIIFVLTQREVEPGDESTAGTEVRRLKLRDHHRVQVPLLPDAPADLRQHLRPPRERRGH